MREPRVVAEKLEYNSPFRPFNPKSSVRSLFGRPSKISSKTNRTWRAKLGLAAVAIFLLALISFPALVSSRFGKDALRQRIFGSWNARVTVGSFQVGWFKPLSIRNVDAVADGKSIIKIGELVTEMPMMQLMAARDDYGTVIVDDLQAVVIQHGDHNNIDDIIKVEPGLVIKIKLRSADIDLLNDSLAGWAKIRDVDMDIEFTHDVQSSLMIIQPVELLRRQTVSLRIDSQMLASLRFLFQQPSIDASVSLRLLSYRKNLVSKKITYTMEMEIHELHIDDPRLSTVAEQLLRKMSGSVADDQLAIVRAEKSAERMQVKLVAHSRFPQRTPQAQSD